MRRPRTSVSKSLRALPRVLAGVGIGVIGFLGAFFVTLLIVLKGSAGGPTRPPSEDFFLPEWADDPAPDFVLPLIADPSHPEGFSDEAFPDFRLSTRESPVVLLEFWADSCAPCVQKFPVLSAIRDRFRGRGFEVYGVLHTFPTWRALDWFEDRGGAPFPQLQDEAGDVADAYGVRGLPHMVLVGSDDRVVWACRGCRGLETRLSRALDSLLPAADRRGGPSLRQYRLRK